MNTVTKYFKKELMTKSSTENLSMIRDFVIDLAFDAGFDEKITKKIALAVDEAVTNIIKHAYKHSPNGDIKIYVEYRNDKLKITIQDKGIHFNPDTIQKPDIQELLRKKQIGGLGIYIMRNLMDEVKYSNPNNDTNEVVLVKYLQS